MIEGTNTGSCTFANILDPTFSRLGVGVRLSIGGPWWVQDFLSP